MSPPRRRAVPGAVAPPLLAALTAALLASACKPPPSSAPGEKVLRYPLRAGVGTMDPVQSSSKYSNIAIAQVFDTLVEFRYGVRPFELQPSLLTEMPEVSEDGRTYTFELKKGVHFQDDPAFESTGGKGPEITSEDVFYSIKRSCDSHWTPRGFWLIDGRIAGLNEYKETQEARRSAMIQQGRGDDFEFDYDAPVEGLRVIDDHRFEIELVEPFPQFLYILTMGYMSIVPREAVEHHGLEFSTHPVGSGPYRVVEFWRGSWLRLERNPTYREDRIREDLSEQELALGLGRHAGERLPFIDRIVFEIYQQDQPMWLKFRAGDLDMTEVPAEYWPTVFEKDGTLRASARAEGLENFNLPLLDLIYWGFNMEDPVWGQPPEMKWVRQAIAWAVDLEERNATFYNGKNTLYRGPIPPGLDGYEPGHRERDVEKARALMARAGHPMGEGLPVLEYDTSKSGNSKEQAEALRRWLKDIGIEIDTTFNSFPELSDKLHKKKSQFFGLAWGADYPDAENFLQLFYGPNESPGSNNFNYKNPEYDALFEEARVMPPSAERTELYRRLRDMVIEDQPMIGSMARTRFYVWNERVRHAKPEEVYYSWFKYLDVSDEPEPPQSIASVD